MNSGAWFAWLTIGAPLVHNGFRKFEAMVLKG
jgi:hypothetical protein